LQIEVRLEQACVKAALGEGDVYLSKFKFIMPNYFYEHNEFVSHFLLLTATELPLKLLKSRSAWVRGGGVICHISLCCRHHLQTINKMSNVAT
jgi:hypothetical protein